jgi:hypothetical protein
MRVHFDPSRGPDAYGDPSALNGAATSAASPPEALPPTAAQLDPPPPNPGVCPTCGQQRPNPLNTFATGAATSDPSLRIASREYDNPLEPEGEDAHRVCLSVRDLYPTARQLPDAIERVIASIIGASEGNFTYHQIDAVVRAEAARLDALDRAQALGAGQED